MALLTGVSVLAGTAPVWAIINADLGFGGCLAMSALAGFLASIAGGVVPWSRHQQRHICDMGKARSTGRQPTLLMALASQCSCSTAFEPTAAWGSAGRLHANCLVLNEECVH
eukprot:GHUV01049974.1.p2 GENE.GHUV01049974.1~~GHUV01049974.1.p2  ORF type:complete len:112 (-),score=21.44 GHUV01049974.1:395-730(-)